MYEEIQDIAVEDYVLRSERGEALINSVEFPHDFPANKYMLIINDVTH